MLISKINKPDLGKKFLQIFFKDSKIFILIKKHKGRRLPLALEAVYIIINPERAFNMSHYNSMDHLPESSSLHGRCCRRRNYNIREIWFSVFSWNAGVLILPRNKESSTFLQGQPVFAPANPPFELFPDRQRATY